jgi:membrane protein YqaA with SNARE-associated domain
MGTFVRWIRTLAVTLGAPGLFLVAFLDSSFLSLPEVVDLLLIWMVTQHPGRLVWYILGATLGSIAGCLILFYLGRKGGEALIRKRFHAASVDRTLDAFRRHGIMAVLIPSILPPPAPFKIFVLLAGVAEISPARFTAAIAIGRGARYLVEGLLAVWYGERALAYIHAHGRDASLAVVGLLAVGLIGYLLWNRRASRIIAPEGLADRTERP